MNIAELTDAFAREQQNKQPLRKATDLPLSFGDITDEWLTLIICARHPGAAVTGHQFGAEDEGNTSRRRIALQYNEAGNAAALPASAFIKATFHLNSRISTGICGGIAAEALFYNDIRPRLDIEAPTGVWAYVNPETLNSFIMLHDMGPGTEFCTLQTEMTDERLYGQMALLARLHGKYYDSPQLTELFPTMATWQAYFAKAISIGMPEICAAGFEAAKSVIPPRLYARAAEIWPATLACVALHEHLPHSLLHTDVHLRNWYIRDGQMGLTDWQGATSGHWSRDVAYAITACTPFERRRALEPKLLQFYLDRLEAAGGRKFSLDEAYMHYRRQLFTALAWWTVTMPHPALPAMQPVESTLEMIRRISTAIDDHNALDSF